GGKIPQRDIERRYREHGDAIAAEQMQVALDLFHEGWNFSRVGDLEAAYLRRNHFLDGGIAGSRADIGKGVSPAGDAGIGGNLDHDDFQRRDGRSALLEARHAGVIGNADMVRPDVGDQHGSLQSRCEYIVSGRSGEQGLSNEALRNWS